MAKVKNAIFKKMCVLCAMLLSQVLGASLLGPLFFSITAAMGL
jgi:hypothetical protein